MPNGSSFTNSSPPVKATELFPELSTDIDRRISHAETRLKFWVIGGVLANLVAGLAIGVPVVYYLGKMDTRFDEVVIDSASNTAKIEVQSSWMREREIWENQVEDHLVDDGFEPPRYGRQRSQGSLDQ